MDYTKIHACPNDFILYRKEYEKSLVCPKCGISRWKVMKNNTIKVGSARKGALDFPPYHALRGYLVQEI